jgi:Bacteriophage HK97-gp10, putative tail-component
LTVADVLSVQIIGDKRLERKLDRLAKREISRIDRNAIGKGMTVVRQAIRAEVPGHMKAIKKSVNSRYKKFSKKGLREAKIGAGVGKKKKEQVPHGHFILMGTRERRHKSGKSVGRIVAVAAVRTGYAKSAATAKKAIEQSAAAGVQAAWKAS